MYNKNKQIHFVGIGGIGMSGIAELLLNLGYQVSGSDLHESDITRRLEDLGAEIRIGHRPEWSVGVDIMVTSSAIAQDNPEVVTARNNHVPIIQRAEMLAELMRLKQYGIGIAGSHGKTSTSSLVSWLLYKAGLDPTVVVGGKVDSLGGNAKLGAGDFLVAEADESDGSFLKLSPVIEVVTNIDLEHLDYYRDLDHIKETFLQFIDKIPFYGAVILCLDDKNIAGLLPKIQKRIITYGLTEQADLYATSIKQNGCLSQYTVMWGQFTLGKITLNAPGRHNILNSLAAIAVGLELNIAFSTIAMALRSFAGVQRRLQIKGEVDTVTVIDDYGHHPTEIRATLDAIRDGWPDRRLVVVFQPHRYSRTQALFDEFTTAFHRADVLILTDIYAASESPIDGISSKHLLSAIKNTGQQNCHYLPNLQKLPLELDGMLQKNDLVLTLGAGNIVHAGEQLLELLNNKPGDGTQQKRLNNCK